MSAERYNVFVDGVDLKRSSLRVPCIVSHHIDLHREKIINSIKI